jgi:hypothetical protein
VSWDAPIVGFQKPLQISDFLKNDGIRGAEKVKFPDTAKKDRQNAGETGGGRDRLWEWRKMQKTPVAQGFLAVLWTLWEAGGEGAKRATWLPGLDSNQRPFD